MEGAAPRLRAGRLEETIVLIPTPQSVVSEGIATLAVETSRSARSVMT